MIISEVLWQPGTYSTWKFYANSQLILSEIPGTRHIQWQTQVTSFFPTTHVNPRVNTLLKMMCMSSHFLHFHICVIIPQNYTSLYTTTQTLANPAVIDKCGIFNYLLQVFPVFVSSAPPGHLRVSSVRGPPGLDEHWKLTFRVPEI